MIKFLTRAELNAYIAATPREGMYAVDSDETMQNKKATFSYFNEELILESGGWKDPNWLTDVDTYADIDTTYLTPIGLDAVKVIADEGHSGQPTWYLHNGTTWIYQGIHFVEGIAFDVSDTNTRMTDIAPDTDYTIPIPYLVGKEHLYIFIDGEEIVKGIDWDEVGTTGFVSTKIQFANTIPKESRLVFKRTIANTNDDKVASRMNKDVFMKYTNDSWTELNALVTSLGFDAVTKTINVDATAGAVVKTVPSNCNIGTRLLYRKIDTSTNGVTINMPAGETVTRANLSTLTLTSRGACWEIEKITDTTWELKGGYDTGTAANGTSAGNFIKSYDGNMIIRQFINVTKKSGPTAVGGLYEYVLNDIPVIKNFVDVNYYISWDSFGDNGAYGVAIHTIGKATAAIATKYIAIHNGVTTVTGYTTLNGRWF